VEALLAKRVDFLTITLYWSSNSVSRRICVICSDPCTQTTWNTSENVWRHPLQSSIRRIRAAASPAPSLTVDNALIALAVKLGGLGILSFNTCPSRLCRHLGGLRDSSSTPA
jgi:hypothetical protein